MIPHEGRGVESPPIKRGTWRFLANLESACRMTDDSSRRILESFYRLKLPAKTGVDGLGVAT
jgi:hypothetical protein